MYILTITAAKSHGLKYSKRKGIFITARVHPGETPGSFVMEGIIKELLSETYIADKLRSQYIFKIVPMLNVDGVVCGNTRCSVMGVDLNRR